MPRIIPTFFFTSLPILASAALNDWNVPCLNGWCSYDLPKSDNSMAASLVISGSQNAISDITPAAGWEILQCESGALAQDIRLVCNSDDTTAAGCDHLFQNGAEGTIVRLPPDCGKSAFARVAKAWVPQDQSIPTTVARRLSRRATTPQVQALSLDTDFSSVPPTQNGDVTLAIQGSNIPSANANFTLTPAALRRRSRKILRRGVFSDFVNKALDTVSSATDFNIDKSQNLSPIDVEKQFPLFDTSIDCGENIKASVSIDADTKAHALVSLGVVAAGTIVPPKISDFGIYAGFTADLNAAVNIDASAAGTVDSGEIKLFEVGIPGLDFPGILSVGPSFKINGQVTGELDIDLKMDVDLNYHIDRVDLFFPPSTDHKSSGNFSPQDSPLSISVSPEVTAKGTLEAHIIPRLDFGIDALDGVASATVFIDLDASAKLELTATAGATFNASTKGSDGSSNNSTASDTGSANNSTATDDGSSSSNNSTLTDTGLSSADNSTATDSSFSSADNSTATDSGLSSSDNSTVTDSGFSSADNSTDTTSDDGFSSADNSTSTDTGFSASDNSTSVDGDTGISSSDNSTATDSGDTTDDSTGADGSQDSADNQDDASDSQGDATNDTTDGQDDTADGQDDTADGQDDTTDGQDDSTDGQDDTLDGQDGTSDGQDGTLDGQDGTSDGQDDISGGQDDNTDVQDDTTDNQDSNVSESDTLDGFQDSGASDDTDGTSFPEDDGTSDNSVADESGEDSGFDDSTQDFGSTDDFSDGSGDDFGGSDSSDDFGDFDSSDESFDSGDFGGFEGDSSDGFDDSDFAKRASTSTSTTLNACVDVSVGLAANAGAEGSFLGLFDDSTKIPIFSKDFDLFKKCVGNPNTAEKRSLRSHLKRAGLTCSPSKDSEGSNDLEEIVNQVVSASKL